MENVIKKISETINSKSTWNINQKIRYAYTELGKNIHLNARFFYSLYQLMDKDVKYSIEELRDIYTNLKPTYFVICRDCAIMLKMIFDNCDIKSKVMETCEVDHYYLDDGVIDVQHFFLCVLGDNDKKYFLSLAMDLPYIQLGMETEHFATNIVYKNTLGEQVYQGPQIHNSVMTKSDIRKLDISIGYLSYEFNNKLDYANVSLNMLKEANQKYKEYLYKLSTNKNNDFYRGLINVMSEDSDSLSVNLSMINSQKWSEIKRYVCLSIKNKIQLEINDSISSEIDYILEIMLNHNEYKKFVELLNKVLKANIKRVEKNGEFSLYALTTSASKLFETIDKINKSTDYKSKDYNKLKTLLNIYISKISCVFIDKKFQPRYDGIFTNEYIANKIKVLFPDIFDFNHNTKFTHMEVGEKTVIINRIMNAIFPELSKDRTTERKKENPVENRIGTCMIYDKYDREYKLLINIEVAGSENNKVLIYNFNDNKNYFENLCDDVSILDMLSNKKRYIFLSKSLEIRAQENIESKKKR